MSPAEYLDLVKERLLTDPIVARFQIRRWDNTPHYPDLPSFPHHVHDGQTGTTQPGRPMDIFAALDQISQLLAQNS